MAIQEDVRTTDAPAEPVDRPRHLTSRPQRRPRRIAPADRQADLPDRLAALVGRQRWRILAGWLVLLALCGGAAMSITTVLSGGGWFVHGSQSERVAAGIASAGLLGRNQTGATLVIHHERHTVTDPGFAADADAALTALKDIKALKVKSTFGWNTVTDRSRERFVGDDQRTVVEAVGMDIDDGAARREMPAAQKALRDQFQGTGMTVSVVSAASLWGDVNQISQEDLVRAEMFCLPLILLILVLLFRSVASAAVAVLIGVSSIVMALGVVSLVARQVEMSIFVENTASMLGLGVGIDYSLFVISRYLEELRAGKDRERALASAIKTSGHTVLFSGLTVILTMSALFLVDLNVIQSIAAGAVLVVAFAVLNATLVLPAILHVLGSRITWGSIGRRRKHRAPADGRRWGAVVRAVMARPVLYGVLVTVALLAVAAPGLGLKTFSPDARILPTTSSVRQGYDLVQDQFGVGQTSPVQVLVRSAEPVWSSATSRQVTSLESSLSALGGVTEVQSPSRVAEAAGVPLQVLSNSAALPADLRQAFANVVSADGRTALISIVPDGPPSSEATRTLVSEVRSAAQAHAGGLDVAVGGETAEGMDSNKVIADSLPKLIAAMLAVIYVVLLVTFRSILLPLKAVAMNLLSVGATYGVLVAVFQNGWGADALGLTTTGNLQNFVPVLLLALLLSLSTDYEVFLLGRVREEYLASGDNADAVVQGVRHTAPLISGAAILMVAVFGAFAFTGMVPIEQLGLGMAVGVLLDATVIRLLLVPAAMKLMGRANWWMPFAGRSSRVTPAPR